MEIRFFDIKNFRKLKQSRVELSKDNTVFVGANNSGKTSAMDALAKFLAKRKFVFNDITLVNRLKINEIGDEWTNNEDVDIESYKKRWEDIMPLLDVWLDVPDNQLQYVSNIIPTLDWEKGLLGIRYLYQPKDIEKLYKLYKEAFVAARNTENGSEGINISLWPKNLCDYLEKDDFINAHFIIKSYILDPFKNENIQETDYMMESAETNPLEGIIKIDIISAQRGFSDTDDDKAIENTYQSRSLSSQLRSYYDKHLNPENEPSVEDLETLQAVEKAKETFDCTLSLKFKDAINELEELGYPGVNDPKITLQAKLSASESLKHESAVQYALTSEDDMKLPEKYNGLGYQNLISMVFLLMRFRDDWMRTGKANKGLLESRIEPLHLVLLEEPEAHLHVQVQQVFIKKAYEVLCNNKVLKSNDNFHTQLVISSHSSHIAKEVDFKDLRYFKRIAPTDKCSIPTSSVINLSGVFGSDDDTTRFITRYLQTTHCDLFFADAAILVEGSAEYMLVPHFIRKNYPQLNERYISILEINGRHSQRLKPLIEKLCLPTLIITDIDSGESDGHHSHTIPKRNNGIISTNYAITKWIVKQNSLDKLIDLPENEKILELSTPYNFEIRIAYQTPIEFNYYGTNVEAIASTFEDCLVYTNFELFKSTDGEGLIEAIHKLCNDNLEFEDFHKYIYELFRGKNVPKAEFALDLIYSIDPNRLKVPKYIDCGLKWLQELLNNRN